MGSGATGARVPLVIGSSAGAGSSSFSLHSSLDARPRLLRPPAAASRPRMKAVPRQPTPQPAMVRPLLPPPFPLAGSRRLPETSCASHSRHPCCASSILASRPSHRRSSVRLTGSDCSSRWAVSRVRLAPATPGSRRVQLPWCPTEATGLARGSRVDPKRSASHAVTQTATASRSRAQAGGSSGREPPRDRRSMSCGRWSLSRRRATSHIRSTPFTARPCERVTTATGCNRHSWTSSSIRGIARMCLSSTKRATCPERGTSTAPCSPTDLPGRELLQVERRADRPEGRPGRLRSAA
jgi:hypothetical protein